MNEIEELIGLDVVNLPPLQPMLYDDLHQNVLKTSILSWEAVRSYI